MAYQTTLNIRTDADVKTQAEKMFDQLGLSMSTAVNIFLRQAIRQGGLPFEVKLDIPNDVTVAAINEGRRLMEDKSAQGYNDMAELRVALDV